MIYFNFIRTGPICEEPGEIENGEVTVINGSPDHLAKNEVIYDMKMKNVGKSRAMELQQLEYKCNKGYMLWGNSRIECQYNNRYNYFVQIFCFENFLYFTNT